MPEQKRETGTLSDLQIKTASNGTHLFKVELALDESSQARGLMFRRTMAADHGMLFIYDPERPIGMWMKNTILSLDMLFVTRDGVITKIFERTEPFSERVLASRSTGIWRFGAKWRHRRAPGGSSPGIG